MIAAIRSKESLDKDKNIEIEETENGNFYYEDMSMYGLSPEYVGKILSVQEVEHHQPVCDYYNNEEYIVYRYILPKGQSIMIEPWMIEDLYGEVVIVPAVEDILDDW